MWFCDAHSEENQAEVSGSGTTSMSNAGTPANEGID